MGTSELKVKVRRKLYNFLSKHVPINTKYRPKGIVKVESLKNNPDVTYYEINPAYTSKLLLSSEFYEQCIYAKPPLSVDYPGDFVVSITNGRIFNIDQENIAIITGDNFFIDGLSFQWRRGFHLEDLTPSDSNSIFTRKMFDPPVKYSGTVFSLISGGGAIESYYHWVIDSMAKLHLLRQSGLFDQVDYFLVPNYVFPYQKQYLDHFGISESKIINANNIRHIQADRLVVASYIRIMAHLPNWVPNFLHRSFITEAQQGTKKLIYISRGDAAINRKVLNEAQVIQLLMPMGFEIHKLSELSVLDQARLFNSAGLIVASHGGGLTNLMFCNPGTQVLEFFPDNYVNHLFYDICLKSGLKYDYFVCKADEHTANLGDNALTNVTVELPVLEAKVKALLA